MAKYIRSPWDPVSLAGSACFSPLLPCISPLLTYSQWPGLDDYQHYLNNSPQSICNSQAQTLTVVAQDHQQQNFVDRYAARIYLRGEIQTREQNWHDFFQLITWRAFPNTKRIINARHYRAAEQRFREQGNSGRRSDTENVLSLFDECGAIVISDDESLLELIRRFDWKTLFYERRNDVLRHMECIVFGHAMLEKMFKPYIGITANSILLNVSSEYFQQTQTQKLQQIDSLVGARIETINGKEVLQRPRDLSPLPLLGIPGYWRDNENSMFYDNIEYFRPGRRKK